MLATTAPARVRPLDAADPGLVYDSTAADWTSYLCAVGAEPTTEDGTDACDTAMRIDPSDLNYASMAVGDLIGQQTLTRRLPGGPPDPARFPSRGHPEAPDAEAGRIDDLQGEAHPRGRHRVTSPIALRAVLLAAPAEVAAAAGQNSTTLTLQVGWSGELTATIRGLHAARSPPAPSPALTRTPTPAAPRTPRPR